MKRTILIVTMVVVASLLGFASGTQESKAETTGEPVTVTWWDWADSHQALTEEQFAKFEQENPDINIEYSLMTLSQFSNAVTLAARSDDLPDISPHPNEMTFLQAMDTGWYQPIDQYIEELYPGGLKAWMDRYPEGTFIEGLSMYQGKVYSAPKKDRRSATSALLYFNEDLFSQAGLNPDSPPETYQQIREFAAKMTASGGGQTYGFIEGGKQAARWRASVGHMAMIGAALTDHALDYKTGRYRYEDPVVVNAIDLLKSIQDDGSYYPGYMAIDAREARSLFGLGRAGFLIQGGWCVAPWKADNPELNFGATFLPPPPSGRKGYIHTVPNAAGGERFMLSAGSDHPEAAARVYLFRTSDEWYEAYVASGDGLAPIPKFNTADRIPFEQVATIAELSEELKRIVPIPTLRDPNGVAAIEAEIERPSPYFEQILQGYMAGQVSDVRGALAELSSKMNAELDRAIQVARDKGADVSRDLFVFPNWDPMEEYTSGDYDEL